MTDISFTLAVFLKSDQLLQMISVTFSLYPVSVHNGHI